MDQTIGLAYKVIGADQVMKTHDQMASKLDTLNQKLMLSGTLFGTLGTNADRAVPHLKNISASLGSITGTARTATAEVRGLTASVAGLKTTMPKGPLNISVAGPMAPPR